MRRTVKERREHPRVPKRIRVHWQRVDTERRDAPRVGPVEATVTLDVSKGGLSFTVAEPLAAGTALALSSANSAVRRSPRSPASRAA
jgi:hypothetical protein